MDALPVHQVMSYHSPGAAGSYKGQRTICLQASMPFWCMQAHTHTCASIHSYNHLPGNLFIYFLNDIFYFAHYFMITY